MPSSATFNLHPQYLCSYPVFVCSGESYLCKIGRQYFSRQQRQITPEVPSDSLRFLEDRQQAWFKLKNRRNYIWVSFCRTGKMAVSCLFFLKAELSCDQTGKDRFDFSIDIGYLFVCCWTWKHLPLALEFFLESRASHLFQTY